jgi:hypothetical protein
MCGRHWGRVHPRLQRLVYRYYRPGQCDDKSPSDEWHKAADAAIGYVAALEDHPLKMSEVSALSEAGFSTKEHEGGLNGR